MALIHQRYDPALGPAVVDLLERLQVFRVFTSWWFSAGLIVLLVSIVVCTLDRTPRLWRQVRDVRVVQPEPFFDPGLPDRAAIAATAAPSASASRPSCGGTISGFGPPRTTGSPTSTATATSTRSSRPFSRTLGLILFLVAAAVTSRFGFEAPLVVDAGETSDRPADRDARAAHREEPRLRGAHPARRLVRRLLDGPCRLSRRHRDRAQDDPCQRSAVGRRVHVPPERVRAGAVHRHPRHGGRVALRRGACR